MDDFCLSIRILSIRISSIKVILFAIFQYMEYPDNLLPESTKKRII